MVSNRPSFTNTLSVIQSFAVLIGLIVGGVWTVIEYIPQFRLHSLQLEDIRKNLEENVALHTTIEDISIHHLPDNIGHFLSARVMIRNNGKQKIRIIWPTASFTASKMFPTGIQNETMTLERLSAETLIVQETLRSGVTTDEPYWAELKGPGTYFLEFSVDVETSQEPPKIRWRGTKFIDVGR